MKNEVQMVSICHQMIRLQIYNIDDVVAMYYLLMGFLAIEIIWSGINIKPDGFLSTGQFITFCPNVLSAEFLLYVFSLPSFLGLQK